MRFSFSLLLISSLFALGSAKTLSHQLASYTFDDYVAEYSKQYSSSEREMRKHIFESRLIEIREHNANPSASYKKGVNHMTDLTSAELNSLLGYNKEAKFNSIKSATHAKRNKQPKIHQTSKVKLPADVDWRSKNVVTPVKDQGRCGSCWSFGTAEVIESHAAIKTGHLSELSQQQILDCTSNPNQCGGSGGCGGGTPELAYDAIKKLGGISGEWTYPYRSYFGVNFDTCSFNSSLTTPVVNVQDYVVLPQNEEEPVKDAVALVGPVVIALDASVFHSYESGVFNGCNTTSIDLNHAVVITGYGTDETTGQDYWIIRNSWSTLYGENGYIRLEVPPTLSCGTDSTPGDGVGCQGGPSSVKVCGPCGMYYDVSYPIIA